MRFDKFFLQILMILVRFEPPLWSTFGDNSGKKDDPKFDAKKCDSEVSRVSGRGGGEAL